MSQMLPFARCPLAKADGMTVICMSFPWRILHIEDGGKSIYFSASRALLVPASNMDAKPFISAAT